MEENKVQKQAPQKMTANKMTQAVLSKINVFLENGALTLPGDYSPENALKSAYLILGELTDKNKRPVMEVCSQGSVYNALLSMVTQGLNPMKNQCYFIAYGDKLNFQRSYLGTIAMAKRVGLKNIVANVIFENDDFVYQIEPETGLTKLVKHDTALENIDITKIKGAYALTTMNDGTKNLTVMNIKQLNKAWNQGTGQTKAHVNFTEEMAKKTVINRACKPIINSSTDGYLKDILNTTNKEEASGEVHQKIEEEAGSQDLDFEDVDYQEVNEVDGESKTIKQNDSEVKGQTNTIKFPEKNF